MGQVEAAPWRLEYQFPGAGLACCPLYLHPGDYNTENLPGQGQRKLGTGQRGMKESHLACFHFLAKHPGPQSLPLHPAVNRCIKQPSHLKFCTLEGGGPAGQLRPCLAMFVLTTNLIDRDLSPFSLAEVGLLCCRFLPGSLPRPHIPTHCGVTDL